MPRRDDHRPEGGWTFVTNHFLVLFCLAEDPGLRMADVAGRVGITERAVQGIVADLVEAGYLTRTRVGRRNHYEVRPGMPMRHLEIQHRQLGDLLRVLGTHDPAPSATGGAEAGDGGRRGTGGAGDGAGDRAATGARAAPPLP